MGFLMSDWVNPVLIEKTVAHQLLTDHLFGWISRWLRSIWCTSAELSRSG
jgi:hypothetical protein